VSVARERARTFVALPLGTELGAELATRCAAVLDGRAFRTARAEGLHLTLYFLGDIARERLAELAAELRASLAGQTAPALRLRGTGAFPAPKRPRVLWVGVEERAHPGRLESCRQAVLAGLAGAGVDTRAEAERAFRPHVTVARPRGRERLPAEFSALALALDWDPVGVELLESCSGPSGSRYERLASFPFTSEK
jgi:2'-5' RNA ligase